MTPGPVDGLRYTSGVAAIINLDEIRAKIQAVATKLAHQKDAYVNYVTGVGTSSDKATFGQWTEGTDLLDAELENLYANNDVAAVIVEKIVDDALRDGFSIRREGYSAEEDAELTKQILYRLVELNAGDQRFARGAVWGRLFGGGGLILGCRGAGQLNRPMDDSKVERVEFIKDWDKQQMQPHTWSSSTGEIETYLYTPEPLGATTDAAQPVEIHRSRILFFPGARTTNRKRRTRDNWDLSVLQRVKDALLSFDAMWANVDAMFSDASQAVFRMQGLIQALGEDTGQTRVDTRLSLMNLFRSASKAIVLDAGDETGAGAEDFKVVDRASLGGLDKVMQIYLIRLATAARMPLTVLLGMAPAGMDATGESDMILYYNTVDIYRKQVLEERLLRLVKLIYQELKSGEVEGDAIATATTEAEYDDAAEWCIVWPELSRPKPLDVATAENMRITSALAMVSAQAWTPEEVALNMDIIAPDMPVRVDLEPRRKALAAAHEEIANREVGLGQMEAAAEVEAKNAPPTAAPPAEKKSERKTPSRAAKKQI